MRLLERAQPRSPPPRRGEAATTSCLVLGYLILLSILAFIVRLLLISLGLLLALLLRG